MRDAKRSSSPDAREDEIRQYGQDSTELDDRYPGRPHNHSPTLPFSVLFLDLFNPLNENKSQPGVRAAVRAKASGSKAPGKLAPHEQRRAIIERFMSRWRAGVGDDFYPALRLILPDKDRDRGVYGLKENAIGKLLVKLTKIDKNSEDGYGLLHWKLPGQAVASRMAGDFAGRCYEVLAKRQLRADVGDMRIAEVNELLDRLAGASGEAEHLPIFDIFYRRMNAEELMWLIRIILKQMKVGATEKTFLDLWHPDGEALFSVSSSLRRVCWELHDPRVRLEQDETGVELMQCFQPQLAQFQMPSSFDKVIQKLRLPPDNPEFWIEEKLDGERMQMHMLEDPEVPGGRRFGFWSRKAKDYTHLYGSGLEDDKSALTRHLEGAFADGVRNLILDGEMITWDPKLDKMVAFGTLKTAALAAQKNPHDDTTPRPLFRVFDLLLLNDQALTRYTLDDRRRALARVVKDVPRRLEIHPYRKTTSPDIIEDMLRQVVADSSEGLVLKNPGSAYRLNSRNDDWIKVKPDYMTEFGESLDCVVIGGYFGSGNRGGTLSSFLCGLRVSENHIRAGADAEKCLSFFKVGGGFKAEDYAEIRHHTEGKWIEWDSTNPPSNFIELAGGERFQYEKPDVWIRPKDSIVLSVKAASVAPSDSFAARETLRFPRLRCLRLDRTWNSALDVDQFQELRNRVDEEIKEKKEMLIESRRTRRPAKRTKLELVIAGQEGSIASGPSATKSGSRIFKGLTFCVLSEATRAPKKTKAMLESLIKENGGELSQQANVESGTVIIADKKVVKVASLMKKGGVDIIRPRWVSDCLAQTGGPFLLPYEKEHLFCATEESERSAARSVDRFGDSYARDIDLTELREISAAMTMAGRSDMSNMLDKDSFLEELERQGHPLERSRGSLFKRCRVHFVLAAEVCRPNLHKLCNYIYFGGGSVATDIEDKEITHVAIVAGAAALKLELTASIRQHISSRRKVPRVVTRLWVEDSWRESTRLDEEQYAPV